MDSMRVAPSLADRWWSIPRPGAVPDVAAAMALFLVEGLVCLFGTFSDALALTSATSAQSHRVATEVHHWALGVFLASSVVFLGAVVRRAPFTAVTHFVIALGVGVVMLPRPAPAILEPVPSHHAACSGQHCS